VRDLARLVAWVATAVFALPSTAAAQNTSIGGRLGATFHQLSQPADPVGEPTVLFGTAFTGFGIVGGASFHREITRMSLGPVFLHADLLFSHQRAKGFAENRSSSARRTLTIHTTGLRLPALAGLAIAGKSSELSVALGPELLLGLAAGSKLTDEGTELGATPAALEVRPVSHLGLAGHLGITFPVNDYRFPIDLRLTWNPFVAGSTRDRFDGYVDDTNTGKYAVAYNWQAVVMVGMMNVLKPRPKKQPVETPFGVPQPVDK
jgi:hypothetical protein